MGWELLGWIAWIGICGGAVLWLIDRAIDATIEAIDWSISNDEWPFR